MVLVQMRCGYVLKILFLVLISDKNLSSTRFQLMLCQFTQHFKVGRKAHVKTAFIYVIVSVKQTIKCPT